MSERSDKIKAWWNSPAGQARRHKLKMAGKANFASRTGTGPPRERPQVPPEATELPDEDGAPSVPEAPDAEFVTPSEVRRPPKPSTSLTSDRAPGAGGWVADMIAAVGEKIHETEFIITGDPRLAHGKADERIWHGLGRYVEETLDISKYGVIILVIALTSAELTRVAILVMDLQKQGKLRKPPQREEVESQSEGGPKEKIK